MENLIIPSNRNGDFDAFFDALTVDELNVFWEIPKVRNTIKRRFRYPGHRHEWLVLCRIPTFKSWGVSSDEIKKFRSLTSQVKFVNPIGFHGGPGSATAHNEIIKIIDSCTDYESYVRRLNNWAYYRLRGGIDSLPPGLRINIS